VGFKIECAKFIYIFLKKAKDAQYLTTNDVKRLPRDCISLKNVQRIHIKKFIMFYFDHSTFQFLAFINNLFNPDLLILFEFTV